MSRYEYPRLTRSEIVSFLTECQIVPHVTEHHLAVPDTDLVSDLYYQLLGHLDLFPEEDGQMEFASLERFENPDLHGEAMRKMKLSRKLKDLIAGLNCPKSFTLKDLVKPDADRTEIFVSAILNFCFHKENKMNLITPFIDEVSNLQEQQREFEDKIDQLNAEIAEHNHASEAELPLLQELEMKVGELSQKLKELNSQQLSLRTVYRKLKDQGVELDEKISRAEYSLIESVQENAVLRSDIVQSPDKLQRALEEKKLACQEAIDAAKSAKQSFENKNLTIEVYTKTHKKMSKRFTQMQKILEQVNSAKSIEKDVKILRAKLSEEGVLDKQLDAELVDIQYKDKELEDLRKTLEKEKDVKCEKADRELNTVKLEMESRRHELESRQRKVETVLEEVDSITSRTNLVKKSCATKKQELLRKSEEVMKEFHRYLSSIQDLLPAEAA